jgi:hypothetical protein
MLRTGANHLIHQAVQIELEELLATNAHRLTSDGKMAVVRNGYQPEREILTGIGPVTVKLPKVRSKDDEPICFHSALVPPYVRKSRSLESALPWLYLKGIPLCQDSCRLDLLDTPDPLATCQGLGAPISNSCRARLRAAVRMNSRYQRGPC